VVIGDGTGPGSGVPEPPGWPLKNSLAEDADVIQGLARVPTVVVTAAGDDTAPRFAAQIHDLPDRVAAVFVTRTDPSRARTVQRLVEQAGGPPVLTDEDATAIALTAATLVYLRRLGRDPYRSRVLIADAIRMPILSPLLLATGLPDITLWNNADATWFPLHRAARDADVVIDLQRDNHLDHRQHGGPGPIGLSLDRPEGSVITHHGLDGRALTAPGLLRAVTDHHSAGTLPLSIGIYRVCAQAVAHATPPRRLLHDQPHERTVPAAATDSIADAVAAALHLALTRPETDHHRPPPPGDRRPHTG
jgi:hypothetical protein